MGHPGVQGLSKYILNNPSTREKVQLRQFARAHLERTGKQPEILCDFLPVLNWLLSSCDYALVESGKESPYSLIYGGSLKNYGSRVLSFVKAIESLGLKVIFCVEESPFCIDKTDALYDACHADYSKKVSECVDVLQICAGRREMSQVKWSLKEGVISHVIYLLELAENVDLVYCKGKVASEAVSYLRSNKHVCGILSTNTNYAIVSGCGLFLPDLFGLDVHQPSPTLPAFDSEQDLSCEVVWSTWLASSLDLSVPQLADLAVLCGNEYTQSFDHKSQLLRTLGVTNSKLSAIVEWIRGQDASLSEMKELLEKYPKFKIGMQASYEVYLREKSPIPLFKESSFISTGGFLSRRMTSIVNGWYWRPILTEPEVLSHPCFNDVTILIRMFIYALMGLTSVTELGRVTASSSLVQIPLSLACAANDGMQQIHASSTTEKLCILYHSVTYPHVLKEDGELKQLLSKATRDVKGIECIDSRAVLLFSSLIFMKMANLRMLPSLNVFVCELEALMVTILSCIVDHPPFSIPDLPSGKAVTLSSWFSHLIDQIYWLASSLGLSCDLPPPGALFSAHSYIPFHLASHICEEHEESTKQDHSACPSSQLKQACDYYRRIWELPPVLQLRAEILKECIPSISSITDLCNSAVNEVATDVTLLELVKEGESVNSKCWIPNAEGCGFVLDLDESVLSGVDSEHSLDGKELSSTQECIATEEDHYFSSQSLYQDCDMESGDELNSDFFELECNEGVLVEGNQVSVISEGAIDDSISSTPFQSTHEDDNTVSKDIKNSEAKKEPSVLVIDSPTPEVSTRLLKRRKKTSKPKIPEPQLPIMEHRSKILELVRDHTVVCIEGETGCGKSTKVPQFILDEAISKESPGLCRIIVTQPRRVAAIKLAERVAAERNEKVGKIVGYCVGGEHHRAAKTMLTYCTVGYLLQVLIHHPAAIQWYSHIILDEIHERSTDMDFAMLVIRKLVAESRSQKIIIMSATMQGNLLVKYFEEQFHFSKVSSPYFVGAKRYPVQTYFMDELDSLADASYWHQRQDIACKALRAMVKTMPRENLKAAMKSVPMVTDMATSLCTYIIVSQCKLGESILVFMPGISSISKYFESFHEWIEENKLANHFRVFILHSQVPLEDQKDAFKDPPSDIVHVILATNIAESSITLPKLRMVINFGIYHQLQYDQKRRISCLKKKWCSHASCAQRAGRAGRVFNGVAIHLFTRQFYEIILPAYDQPEIMNSPLARLVLQAKVIGGKLGMSSPSEFLCSAIERPSLEQMESALNDLAELGAITSSGDGSVNEEADITLIGYFSLSLPVDLVLSRLILFSIFFGIPFEGITIAASLSLYQDVFTLPSRIVIKNASAYSYKLKNSTESRAYFDRGQYSDSVMVCNMFRDWIEFRNSHLTGSSIRSKYALIRAFCKNNAIRWERLLQLETSVAHIANRASIYLPKDHKIYRELMSLVSLTDSSGGIAQLHESTKKKHLHKINIHVCSNVLVVKALLVASFTNQLIIGCQEVNSENPNIRKRATKVLNTMKDCCLDPANTVVMNDLPEPTLQSLDLLTLSILPHQNCRVMINGNTGYISLVPKFGTNPKTNLMVQQALARGENIIKTETGNSSWNPFMTETSIVKDKIVPDMVHFWQFGERKFSWSVQGIKEQFTRPHHPLAVHWNRLSLHSETASLVNWRQPSCCAISVGREPKHFLGVTATMQGGNNRNFLTARDVTLLPNCGDCCLGLLLLLAFQPHNSSIKFLVDKRAENIISMSFNNFIVPFNELQFLTRDDLIRINALRKAISVVLCYYGEDEALFPMEEIARIHSLLDCVLSRSPGNLFNLSKDVSENQFALLEWDAVMYQNESGEEESFTEEFEYPSLSSFCYYPQISCDFLSKVEVSKIPEDQLKISKLFCTDEAFKESVVYSLDKQSKLKQRPHFKLSPLAKSFQPSGMVTAIPPSTAAMTNMVSHKEISSCSHSKSEQIHIPPTTVCKSDLDAQRQSGLTPTFLAGNFPTIEGLDSNTNLELFQRKPTHPSPMADRYSFDISHLVSLFPTFPGFGPIHSPSHSLFNPLTLAINATVNRESNYGPTSHPSLSELLNPYTRASDISQEHLQRYIQFFTALMKNFNQLLWKRGGDSSQPALAYDQAEVKKLQVAAEAELVADPLIQREKESSEVITGMVESQKSDSWIQREEESKGTDSRAARVVEPQTGVMEIQAKIVDCAQMTQPDCKTEVEECQIEEKKSLRVEPKPQVQVESGPLIEVEPKPQAQVEPGPLIEEEPKPQAQVEPEPEPQTGIAVFQPFSMEEASEAKSGTEIKSATMGPDEVKNQRPTTGGQQLDELDHQKNTSIGHDTLNADPSSSDSVAGTMSSCSIEERGPTATFLKDGSPTTSTASGITHSSSLPFRTGGHHLFPNPNNVHHHTGKPSLCPPCMAIPLLYPFKDTDASGRHSVLQTPPSQSDSALRLSRASHVSFQENKARVTCRYTSPICMPLPPLAVQQNHGTTQGEILDERKRRKKISNKEREQRSLSAFFTNQYYARYRHPPWTSNLFCASNRVDPALVYNKISGDSPRESLTINNDLLSKPWPVRQMFSAENIPEVSNIWGIPAAPLSRGRKSKLPNHKTLGIRDQFVVRFLYHYLKTVGVCPLKLLCGPVYWFLLNSSGRPPAGPMEFLPISFLTNRSEIFSISYDGVVTLKEGLNLEETEAKTIAERMQKKPRDATSACAQEKSRSVLVSASTSVQEKLSSTNVQEKAQVSLSTNVQEKAQVSLSTNVQEKAQVSLSTNIREKVQEVSASTDEILLSPSSNIEEKTREVFVSPFTSTQEKSRDVLVSPSTGEVCNFDVDDGGALQDATEDDREVRERLPPEQEECAKEDDQSISPLVKSSTDSASELQGSGIGTTSVSSASGQCRHFSQLPPYRSGEIVNEESLPPRGISDTANRSASDSVLTELCTALCRYGITSQEDLAVALKSIERVKHAKSMPFGHLDVTSKLPLKETSEKALPNLSSLEQTSADVSNSLEDPTSKESSGVGSSECLVVSGSGKHLVNVLKDQQPKQCSCLKSTPVQRTPSFDLSSHSWPELLASNRKAGKPLDSDEDLHEMYTSSDLPQQKHQQPFIGTEESTTCKCEFGAASKPFEGLSAMQSSSSVLPPEGMESSLDVKHQDVLCGANLKDVAMVVPPNEAHLENIMPLPTDSTSPLSIHHIFHSGETTLSPMKEFNLYAEVWPELKNPKQVRTGAGVDRKRSSSAGDNIAIKDKVGSRPVWRHSVSPLHNSNLPRELERKEGGLSDYSWSRSVWKSSVSLCNETTPETCLRQQEGESEVVGVANEDLWAWKSSTSPCDNDVNMATSREENEAVDTAGVEGVWLQSVLKSSVSPCKDAAEAKRSPQKYEEGQEITKSGDVLIVGEALTEEISVCSGGKEKCDIISTKKDTITCMWDSLEREKDYEKDEDLHQYSTVEDGKPFIPYMDKSDVESLPVGEEITHVLIQPSSALSESYGSQYENVAEQECESHTLEFDSNKPDFCVKSSSALSVKSLPDRKLYSPPEVTKKRSKSWKLLSKPPPFPYSSHFMQFCQSELLRHGRLTPRRLINLYRNKYQISYHIDSTFFWDNPDHFQCYQSGRDFFITLTSSQLKSLSKKSSKIQKPGEKFTELPSVSRSELEKEIVEELVNILTNNNRARFFSEILQDENLAKILSRDVSMKLDKQFFERKPEFEVSTDNFDMDEGDFHVFLTEKGATPPKKYVEDSEILPDKNRIEKEKKQDWQSHSPVSRQQSFCAFDDKSRTRQSGAGDSKKYKTHSVRCREDLGPVRASDVSNTRGGAERPFPVDRERGEKDGGEWKSSYRKKKKKRSTRGKLFRGVEPGSAWKRKRFKSDYRSGREIVEDQQTRPMDREKT